MNKSDNDFSPHESLQLIRSMIETTKHSISDNSPLFLIWGYATLIGCFLQYFLYQVMEYPRHYYAWFVTLVALVLHFIFIYKYKRREQVITFIDEANRSVWTFIGVSYLSLSVVFSKIGWQYCFPFYILLYGIGTAISGSLLKFKPLQTGGIICLALAAFTPFVNFSLQILLAAFAILISYIIPGHLLRNQYRRTKKIINAQ